MADEEVPRRGSGAIERLRRILVPALAGSALVFSAPAVAPIASRLLGQNAQTEVTIVMSNPSSHPRVGVPDFLVGAPTNGEDGDALAAAAEALTDVLWKDLDFEREFYMIPRLSSASIPPAAPESVPYERWRELGADFVLVGNVSQSGPDLGVEVRLLATRGSPPGQQAFGASYLNCSLQSPRRCAHTIADDLHKQTRRLDGVARTRLAFASDRQGSRQARRRDPGAGISKEIYVSDYDGANALRVTVNGSLNLSPAWSPTGGLLAYASWVSDFPDIYVANLAQPGRVGRPAAASAVISNYTPAWSPDGSRLAFASNRSGNLDVWVVNRDGTGLQNLTNHPAQDGTPVWSPSGAQIAFASDRAGVNQLYVMSAAGTGVQRLVSAKVDRPTWSPLNFIAFTIGGGPYDIALFDFATASVSVLTNGVGSNESPTIAPNGRHIAFVTTRWGRQDIATMDRAGQHVRRVTTAGNNTFPNWEPIPGR